MKSKIHIFLIRGLTRESGHWGQFCDFLHNKIQNVQIHYLDLPGAGKYVNQKAYSRMDKMVDFMKSESEEIISSSEGTKIILATSLAGIMAVDWVTRYPNDFHGIITVGSGFKGICSPKERVGKKVLSKMFRILISTNIQKRERLIIEVNSNRPDSHQEILKEWINIQHQRKMSRLNIFRQTLAGMRFKINNQKILIPLLIVGSRGDQMVDLNCIKKTHEVLGGTLILHESSGHGIALDEPDWLANVSCKWIQMNFN